MPSFQAEITKHTHTHSEHQV